MKINELFRFILKPGERLSRRVLTATFWNFNMRISTRALSFVRIIILARILSPEAFGLVAVGLLGIDLVMVLSNLGFNYALVQKKGDIKEYLDTAWVMTILRGLFMAGVLFSCAAPIAGFFGSREASNIVKVMASLVLIDGFTNSGMVYLLKELEVKKQFIYGMVQAITDLAVTIPLAIILRSPWALVYGAIASNIAGLIGSYIIQPYRPHFRFNFQKARTLFQFGKWLTLSSWVDYISSRGDSIFIGRLLGVAGLGLYQMAHRVSDIYSLEISVSIMNVLFPAYSKAQSNIPKLREAFLLSMEIMASVVFPLGVTIYLLAPVFTPVIFGQQWLAATMPMGIFGIAAAFGCLLNLGKSLFYGLGRPSLSFYMTLISTAVMFGLFWPLYKLFGLSGGAIAVLFGSISPFPLFIYQSMKHLEIDVRQIIRIALAPLAISLIITGVSVFSLKYISIQSDVMQLTVICIAIGLASIAIAYALWKWFKIGPFRLVTLWK